MEICNMNTWELCSICHPDSTVRIWDCCYFSSTSRSMMVWIWNYFNEIILYFTSTCIVKSISMTHLYLRVLILLIYGVSHKYYSDTISRKSQNQNKTYQVLALKWWLTLLKFLFYLYINGNYMYMHQLLVYILDQVYFNHTHLLKHLG